MALEEENICVKILVSLIAWGGALCLDVWNHVWVLQMLKVKGASLSQGRCLCSALLWHPCEVCEQRLKFFLIAKKQNIATTTTKKKHTSNSFVCLVSKPYATTCLLMTRGLPNLHWFLYCQNNVCASSYYFSLYLKKEMSL